MRKLLKQKLYLIFLQKLTLFTVWVEPVLLLIDDHGIDLKERLSRSGKKPIVLFLLLRNDVVLLKSSKSSLEDLNWVFFTARRI